MRRDAGDATAADATDGGGGSFTDVGADVVVAPCPGTQNEVRLRVRRPHDRHVQLRSVRSCLPGRRLFGHAAHVPAHRARQLERQQPGARGRPALGVLVVHPVRCAAARGHDPQRTHSERATGRRRNRVRPGALQWSRLGHRRQHLRLLDVGCRRPGAQQAPRRRRRDDSRLGAENPREHRARLQQRLLVELRGRGWRPGRLHHERADFGILRSRLPPPSQRRPESSHGVST